MNILTAAPRWLFCTGFIVFASWAYAGEQSITPAPDATLALRTITPEPGSIVGRYSRVVAELEYSIRDFKPHTYFVIVQFDSTVPNMTRSGMGKPIPREWGLRKPTGTVKVSQQFRDVWSDQKVARPFKVWFYLNRRGSGDDSEAIATVGPLEFVPQ